MHYPVMNEKQVAARWRISVKSLRRWRQLNIGPKWHKLFHLVRYHVADVLALEIQNSSPCLHLIEQKDDQGKGLALFNTNALDDRPPVAEYTSARAMATISQLPYFMLTNPKERERRKIPHLQVVSMVRFSPLAVWHWELANSVPGCTEQRTTVKVESEPQSPPRRIPRWYEVEPLQSQPTISSLPEIPANTHDCPPLPSFAIQ